MPKKRIFQVAKELNISHLEIMSFLKDNGIEVATHMSPIDDEIYESILSEFNKERLEIERLRKDKARQAIITSENEIKMEEKTSLDIKEEEKESPLEKEKTLGLKIIKRPDKLKTEKKDKEPVVLDKKESKEEEKTPSSPPKRKLKQIDISAIAEKINRPKKEQKKTSVDSSVLNKSLSTQSKKKRKKKKTEESDDLENTSNVIKINLIK